MRFRLLQARVAGDPVREEERLAFAREMRVDPATITTYDVLSGRMVRDELTESVDAVLVGGSGAFGVCDDEPWMSAFIQGVGEIAESGFPMFASCFGFQALVVAYGGEVRPDPERSEVGSYDLLRTPEAEGDALFGALPPVFVAQLGHKDRAIRMPTGIPNLASSERCPFQALRVPGKPTWATQFHPELSHEANRTRFGRYFEPYAKAFGKAEAERMLREGFRPGPESNALLAQFVAYVQAHR